MPILEGLEVRIESGGLILPEHNALAEATTVARKHAISYIEITPGATFGLYLSTTDGFAYGDGDGLKVQIEFDDQDSGWVTELSKDQARHFKSMPDDEMATPESRQWLGQIRVVVNRVRRSRLPRPAASKRFLSSFTPAKVGKKLLVEKGLTHVVAGVDERVPPCLVLLADPCNSPFSTAREVRPIDGQHLPPTLTKPEMLEHLGYLAPSPHLMASDEASQTADADGSGTARVESEAINRAVDSSAPLDAFPPVDGLTADEQQELKEIQARYAVLRQKHARADARPKQETDAAPAGAVIGSGPRLPSAVVKREPPDVIDLTLD
ncbi:MAG: hypothetical protein M1826_004030 [Phylliscum demangeonii]|nr:MAG: hypothetical protein M1826_004030 [Phylliscum demangeonii]